MPKNIVQMNNRYIQDEHQRQKYQNEERKKQNRFMGWVLILIIYCLSSQPIIWLRVTRRFKTQTTIRSIARTIISKPLRKKNIKRIS